MANVEKHDDLIIGSGIAGKFIAWTGEARRNTKGALHPAPSAETRRVLILAAVLPAFMPPCGWRKCSPAATTWR
jgi:hypothetical protein